MNGLDLFSGIGGISLALEPWVRTVAYCEQDRYAQGVLMSRMRDGSLDRAPIWDDVRTLRADHFADSVDIIFGGFPCQDISVAGNGAGLGGERSGLFFEIARLVDELRPQFVFLENVPVITVRGLDTVVGSFSELSYDCRWTIVSAAELGAPHIRKRWFILAHSNSLRLREEQRTQDHQRARPLQPNDDGSSRVLADANGLRKQSKQDSGEFSSDRIGDSGWWSVEPNVGRVADGIPKRVDRLRCLGNAVVPAAAREAFVRLSGLRG